MATNFKQSLSRFARLFFAFFACAMLVFSAVYPANAVTSNPRDGESNLMEIEKKSQEVVLSDPYDFEKTSKEANQGINEVQGDADKDKMFNPSNSKSTSFESQVKGLVDNITNKD